MTKWLNSGCDLGKDLRAKREISKLVKRKEYRVLLHVLILLGLPRVTINGSGLSKYGRRV